MNTRFLCSVLAVTLALPLAAQAQRESLFPMRSDSPYGVPVRLGEQAAAPAAPTAVPQTMQPVAPAPPVELTKVRPHFSADVRAFYGFRAVPHSTYATDMAGMEAEFAWYFTPRQALTVGASYGAGGNDTVNYVHTPHGQVPVSEDFTRSDFNLLLGYRFTQMLTPRTSVSFALKGGLDVQELSYDDFRGCHDRYCDCERSYSETECGFAYAASAMLVTSLTPRFWLQFGYQFRGATTTPKAPSAIPGGEPVQANSMRWHEAHIGLRFLF